MLVFDDTYEHEAGNMSKSQQRVILLIDIWHPDLHLDEREAIKDMFGVVKDMIKKREGESKNEFKVDHVEEGTGEKCPKGAHCIMHYHGTLADGSVFDSAV